MALTRDFKETVKERAERDPEFRNGLLTEAIEAFVRGELEVGKALLRDFINATDGFKTVGKAIDKSPKSLMRMLSHDGNPTAANLFTVTRYLQDRAGGQFHVRYTEPKTVRNRRHANCA
jgi:DNA-binding phage protein